jgi:hypothetical protein
VHYAIIASAATALLAGAPNHRTAIVLCESGLHSRVAILDLSVSLI